MGSLSSSICRVKYLLCVMDVFTKYAWIKPLKDKKGIYSTHNEGKSVVAEKFIKTLKGKVYKTVAANDSRSYLSYLNELVDQHNNTYHRPIGEKPADGDYSTLTEKIELSHKAPKYKVGERVRITQYKNIFSKGYTNN